MKKLFFIIPLVALASCNLDNGDAIKETRNYSIANFFLPENEESDPVVSMGSYTCLYLPNSNSMEMSVNNLKTASSDISFGVSNVTCYYGYASNGMEAAQFGADTPVMTNGLFKISKLNGIVTPFFYYYDCPFASLIGYGNQNPLILMKYKIDGLGSVSTFPNNAFYCGETVTQYSMRGVEKTYNNKEIIYRVTMDVANKKATLIIYKGRFAEEMPSDKVPEALVLKDLEVTFSRNGYVIKGENVIPELADKSGLTPYKNYTFDNIEIVSNVNELSNVTDLTDIRCTYTVAGMYNGTFSGSCYAKSDSSN